MLHDIAPIVRNNVLYLDFCYKGRFYVMLSQRKKISGDPIFAYLYLQRTT
jgi:hypothetical protein